MTKEWINKTIKEHHEMMIEKGFYDCHKCIGEGGLQFSVDPDDCCLCSECKGTGKDPNKNIGELLMLVVSELGEALEAHRCGRFAKWEKLDHNNLQMTFENHVKDTFEDEIADVFLRLFDLCGYLGIEYKSPDRKIKALKKELDNKGEVFLLATGILCEMFLDESIDIDVHFVIDYLSFFSNKWNIQIQKHIEAKMAYNKTRPQKHGKRY